MMRRRLTTFCFLLAPALLAADFPALYNSEPGNPTPTPPKEALAKLRLPEGFKATLFAAEPDVQNPIAMAWDAKGRMWVAENYTYAERTQRFDLSMRDRVIILEDKDNDGVAESRKVFTGQVQMLTSVEVGRGGVWLMCPPQVLFIPDANNDDIPDGPPQVVLDGFTVAKDNYHNFANGLKWGPDGWLYGRCGHSCPGRLGVPGTPDEERIPIKGGIWRFHPERKVVEVLTHGTTNPWGHDWDENGEMFFINTVTGHLWHLIPGAHLHDTSPSPNPHVYERLDTIADHYHYDTKGSWSDSRDGKANNLGGGHAHIGMMIYQGTQWPEYYRNKLFTLNMHGRRTNVERLERDGSGYVGKHEPDIFLSDDPWFRGIEISTGPDGNAFILDWSDTGECHESTGVHRTSGRIFKVSYGEPAPPEQAFAWRKALPPAAMDSPNEYSRVRAIRALTDEWPLDTILGPLPSFKYPKMNLAQLERLATTDPSPLVRLAIASSLQRIPVSKRPGLASLLVAHQEDASEKNLPHLVWYGLIPVGDKDPMALVSVAKACTWPKTLRWISRNLAGRIETNPAALNALLYQSHAQSLEFRLAILQGIGDALQGWRKAPKPASWDAFATTFARSKEPGMLVRDLAAVFGDGRALDGLKNVVYNEHAEINTRIQALKTLIEARPPDLEYICKAVLETRGLNAIAARGLALSDHHENAEMLIRNYRKFHVDDRPAIIGLLTSRPSFARVLLEQIAAKKIPRADLSAFDARQIHSLKDESLSKQLVEVWGELRESAADKQKLIADLKSKLTPAVLAQANLSNGRALYQLCAACHTLYGEGGKVGPDLTGSGRANLDYLLENIVDPSAVVSADYRMTVLTLKDGRVLSGVVAAQNDRTLTLRLLTEETTVEKSEIAKQETSPASMMPEGLLLALQPDQVRDLIAYLMHPTQVALPGAQ
jgi:putative membrane-bound dehydrogenase-like protein